MLKTLINRLSALPEVEAIALAGSRASGASDAASDYDLYVYVSFLPEEARRLSLLKDLCQVAEISNHFWEVEDNAILKDGTGLDLVYRHLDAFENGLESILARFQPSNGYTTCMWKNLQDSQILFDRNGRLEELKERFSVPYPQKLKENIITRNTGLLFGALPNYTDQIKKAIRRRDLVSLNHRTAAYLESYFDILYALNEKPHPGEKRLIPLGTQLALLPKGFETNLQDLFSFLYSDPEKAESVLQTMNEELKILLKKEGISFQEDPYETLKEIKEEE